VRERVESILGDVKTISSRVNQQTERVDQAINGTMDRVDETAERVKHSMRDKVNQAAGVVRGLRAVVASVLSSIPTDGNARRPGSAADAAGRF
jgi:phage-related minor tail protein